MLPRGEGSIEERPSRSRTPEVFRYNFGLCDPFNSSTIVHMIWSWSLCYTKWWVQAYKRARVIFKILKLLPWQQFCACWSVAGSLSLRENSLMGIRHRPSSIPSTTASGTTFPKRIWVYCEHTEMGLRVDSCGQPASRCHIVSSSMSTWGFLEPGWLNWLAVGTISLSVSLESISMYW